MDESCYESVPDWKIPLTSEGKRQAKEAGDYVKKLIGNEPISTYCSPYLRTKQTLEIVMQSFEENPIEISREEPRLTEQQFGNFQKREDMEKYKRERSQFGRFYYRFPNGESGLDVYSRVSSFIGTLFREWAKPGKLEDLEHANIIIITHGLTARLFLMRWFQYSVEEFERSLNPSNASVIIMERKYDREHDFSNSRHGRVYSLDSESKTKMNLPEFL